MFERYTNGARRTVFFARFEASRFGSPYIETEHLLLGLLREDRSLRKRLPIGAAEQIRKRIEERVEQPVQSTATSVDLPLSRDCKRALHYAAEESKALGHAHIDCGHLALGILHIESAAALLRDFGIEYAGYREVVAQPVTTPPLESPAPLPASVVAGPLGKAAADLQRMLGVASELVDKGPERLKRTGWTRKEALGHLIDWATVHQRWFARALPEPKVAADGYPEDACLSAQGYNDLPWHVLVDLCASLNRPILYVMTPIPEEKLDTPCRIGVAEPVALRELVRRYVAHCEDVVAQLLMQGDGAGIGGRAILPAPQEVDGDGAPLLALMAGIFHAFFSMSVPTTPSRVTWPFSTTM
jgi:hypothetical protein